MRLPIETDTGRDGRASADRGRHTPSPAPPARRRRSHAGPVQPRPEQHRRPDRGVQGRGVAANRVVQFRGADNAVASLSDASRQRGVVGVLRNHAQALALAGRLLGVPVTVVAPRDAPAAKVNGARSLGARVVTYDRHRDDRDEITAGLAAEYGYSVVPSANHPAVMAGAGTVALELLRQAPGLTTILVPVGRGGRRPAPPRQPKYQPRYHRHRRRTRARRGHRSIPASRAPRYAARRAGHDRRRTAAH